MNVFLFQNKFEAPILAGIKVTTIRRRRKDGKPRAKAGEIASLRVWTGKPYRSKQREFAQRKVEFTFPVRIGPGVTRLDMPPERARLVPRLMARTEGFANWPEMKAWFKAHHGLPFEGELVKFEAR